MIAINQYREWAMFMEDEQDLDLATEVRSRCRSHQRLRSQL